MSPSYTVLRLIELVLSFFQLKIKHFAPRVHQRCLQKLYGKLLMPLVVVVLMRTELLSLLYFYFQLLQTHLAYLFSEVWVLDL